jgi:hypothetical protein
MSEGGPKKHRQL